MRAPALCGAHRNVLCEHTIRVVCHGRVPERCKRACFNVKTDHVNMVERIACAVVLG
jgi:hypothetical protein